MLKDQLQKENSEALKSGNTLKRSVLAAILTSIQNKELNKRTILSKTETDPVKLEEGSKLSDEEIMEVLSSEAKKRKESIEQFTQGNRSDLADKEKLELELISAYLPEQMNEEDVTTIVKEAISKTGASTIQDIGSVMGEVMKTLKGKADGGLISNIVKKELGSK
ncbi:MAG: GatB/YqeY domain-containing protein [Parcubacteria group bacterium]